MASNSTLPSGFAEGSWWYYAPNKVAPMIFAVLFLISGAWHLYQNIKYKSWMATALIPLAAFVFAGGYVVREVGAFHYDWLGLYMASSIALLCSPPVYEATNCFILGRLMYYVPYAAPLHPWRLMATFGTLEVITEAVTANGASKATAADGDPGDQVAGRILLDVSLILQIITMVCFIAFAIRFEYNCRYVSVFPDNLRKSLRIVYVSCALIGMRSIYRAVEWFGTTRINPTDPYSFPPVLRHEACFYVFEASAMLLNTFLLNIFHPTSLLPQNFKIFIAPDGVTEMEGKGLVKKDPRKLWLKLCDPFDLSSIFATRDRHARIWEEQTEMSAQPSSDVESEVQQPGWERSHKDDDLVTAV
ncbi:putative RTA1 domain protein [Calocera viscosa TUFC12733]|uniref:Putative RTA1 domain protein n=1 Tax=Calocera viscosa (strain TUFC12733) TaxID=1330018 RepID=A0A167JKL1_CALVF|nr:putative RTA1 domain protein [Calocera viscosa TUFC12733]